jgi:hypothetical protein
MRFAGKLHVRPGEQLDAYIEASAGRSSESRIGRLTRQNRDFRHLALLPRQ